MGNMEKFTASVNTLHCLLHDPKPGLRSWQGAVTLMVGAIPHQWARAQFAGRDPRPMTSTAQEGDVIRIPPRDGLYVVVRAALEGGGTGHGPHDVYPDGWHVTACRLHEDGTYDPAGHLVDFYQSGCFNDMLPEVELVSRMTKTYTKGA